jgi:dTDP-4-amino-4,6-dideoxygalactose transaminase
MYSAHQITREFEASLCEYTGAKYAVAVNSCTMALLLAVAWNLRLADIHFDAFGEYLPPEVDIPKRTYVGVPMSIVHAGGRPTFRDEDWIGAYQLKPLPVWDSARFFTSGMYRGRVGPLSRDCSGQMVCVSFHTAKILGDTQGGAILHDDPEADKWLRRARFDGRTEGVAPKDDRFDMIGWHCYLSPDVSARLLWRMSVLPKHNEPLPNDEYPDLSQHEAFK